MSLHVATATPPSTFRSGVFRTVAVLIGLLLIVLFGAWQSILAPWVTMIEAVDHGWVRTPELHRLADGASAILMGTTGVAALVVALRPKCQDALMLWSATVLVMLGLAGPVSTVVQGNPVIEGFVFAVLWFAVLVAPLVLLHPERSQILRGGATDNTSAPSTRAVILLRALGALGLALVVGAAAWRLSGGVFENAKEDDFIGLMLLGMAVVAGCILCLTRRNGWRALAFLLAVIAIYSLIATMTIALD